VGHDDLDRARAAIDLGRGSVAVTLLTRHLAFAPGDAEALTLLAEAHLLAGDADRALDAARAAVAADPDAIDAHAAAGEALLELRRPAVAVEAFTAAVRLDPHSAVRSAALGVALVRAGRPAEALAAYDRALRLNPLLAEAHQGRGVVLDRLGRPREARAATAEALRLDPHLALAHNSSAVEDMARGRLTRSAAALSRALRADPHHTAIRSNVDHLVLRLSLSLFRAGILALVVAGILTLPPENDPLAEPGPPARVAAVAVVVLLVAGTFWRVRSAPAALWRVAFRRVRRDPYLLLELALGLGLHLLALLLAVLSAEPRTYAFGAGFLLLGLGTLMSFVLRRRWGRRRATDA
jgi:tetratricopeptide (TPR) repeat protein